MSSAPSDRNLLIGVLGLQMDLFNPDQLATAIKAWASRKADCLEAILLEQKAITINQFDFLRGIAENYLALHNNDPVESLATLSSFQLVEVELRKLQDEEIDQSLTRVNDFRRALDDATQPLGEQTLDFSLKSSTPMSGRDRFRILRPHAKGGLGQVSIAEDAELHREVALKEIQPAYADDPESRNRFLIEAELTGRLEHPGIVPVYSLGKTATGNPYYVMRFIRGDSLKESIAALYSHPQNLKGEVYRMGLRKLVQRLIDVCNAIEYAHSRGVLHRDLKPGNIMLGKYGETLVVDWGLAKTGAKSNKFASKDEETFVPTSGDGSTETRLGTIVGTPSYMSPEQARGDLESLGPASDVYSLGATLYSVLTGQPPVQGHNRDELIKKVIAGQIEPIPSVNPQAPVALIAVCKKAMSVQAADRYSTPMQLADDLEQWLADEPVAAYKEPFMDRAWRFVRRHRTAVATSFAVVATALVALIGNSIIVQRKNKDLQVARDAALDSQQLAVSQRQRAESLLKTAQNSAIVLWTAAERTLPALQGQDALVLRQQFTEQALRALKSLWEQSPNDADLQFEYSRVLRVASNLSRTLQEYPTAETRIMESIRLQSTTPNAQTQAFRQDHLAATYRDEATLRTAMGQLDRAAEALTKAREILRDLVAADPVNPNYKRTGTQVDLQAVEIDQERMEYDAALVKARRLTADFESLAALADAHPTDQIFAVAGKCRQARLLSDSGHHDEALQMIDAGLAAAKQLIAKTPNSGPAHVFTARAHYWKAEFQLLAGGDPDSSFELAEKAVQMFETLIKARYLPQYGLELAESLRVQAKAALASKDVPKAESLILRAKEEALRVLDKSEEASNLEVMAKAMEQMAEIKLAAQKTDAATTAQQEAVEYATKALKASPGSKRVEHYLARLQQANK